VACRRLRAALLAAVDGLALRVPTAVPSGAHAALAGVWGLASSLTVGAYADRYVGTYGDAAVVGVAAPGTGAAGAVATALGRWLYFFPAVPPAGAADRTPALASFVRSVPALAGAVEVWDGHAGEGADGSSTQLLFLLRPPPQWRTAVTAAAAAAEAKAAAAADAATTAAGTDGVGAADAGAAHGGDAVDDDGGGAAAAAAAAAECVSSVGRLFLKGASPLQYAVAQHLGVPVCVFPDPDFGALRAAVARAAAAGAPTVVRHATLGMLAGVRVRTVGAALRLHACDRSIRSDHECKRDAQAP